MDSCANTFPREPISRAGHPKNSRRLLMASTRDLERPLAGRHQRKPSTSTYNQFNKQVLHPPVELSQYVSIRYSERLSEAEIVASVGSKGDSYDCQSFSAWFRKNRVVLAGTV